MISPSQGLIKAGFQSKKVLVTTGLAVAALAVAYLSTRKNDTSRFSNMLVKMNAIEEHAIEKLGRLQTQQTASLAAKFVRDSTLPEWKAFQGMIDKSDALKLDEDLSEKRSLLKEYASLRVKQAELMYDALAKNSTDFDPQLKELDGNIERILNQLGN